MWFSALIDIQWCLQMAEESPLSSQITCGVTVLGNVVFDGHLVLDGKICGNVSSPEGVSGHVSVLPNGCVEGNLHAQSAVIGGSLYGSLHVVERMTVLAGARIRGDVRYSVIEVQMDAQVEGRFLREDPAGNVVVFKPAAQDGSGSAVSQGSESLK
jgi:cytoskeletal protein CcmA (bactofilin family)